MNTMKKLIIIATGYTYGVLSISITIEQHDAYVFPFMQSELAATPGFMKNTG
jgi:hypothetical protein